VRNRVLPSTAAQSPTILSRSILFGHEKGAFTGATERHPGKFVEASGGTLFLDEVGELRLRPKSSCCGRSQEGEVEPVGARKTGQGRCQADFGHHRNLVSDVKAGRFREDLFYRLHVFPIAVPPLRRTGSRISPIWSGISSPRFAAEEGSGFEQSVPRR